MTRADFRFAFIDSGFDLLLEQINPLLQINSTFIEKRHVPYAMTLIVMNPETWRIYTQTYEKKNFRPSFSYRATGTPNFFHFCLTFSDNFSRMYHQYPTFTKLHLTSTLAQRGYDLS